MSFTQFNTEEIAAAIAETYPLPNDLFETGKYLLDLEDILKDMAVTARERFNELLPELQTTWSETYLCCQTFRSTAAVDIERLRKDRPDILERIVYVAAYDAEKLLTRRRIYELCCESAGADIIRYQKANLGDLEKALPKDDAAVFVRTIEKPTGWGIFRRGDE